MAPPVTEVVTLTLKPGVDPQSGESAKTWESIISTISSQPGCRDIYWGHTLEDPTIMNLTIDWDSRQAHQDFEDSPGYKDFIETVQSQVSDLGFVHAQIPTGDFAIPANAGATELLTLYFPTDYENSKFESEWNWFVEKGKKAAKEATGLVGGWVEEQVDFEKDGNTQKAKAFWGAIGWPSKEAHLKFRETEDFKEVIPHLRGEPIGAKVHHTKFNKH